MNVDPRLFPGLVAAVFGMAVHKVMLHRALATLDDAARNRFYTPAARPSPRWTVGFMAVAPVAYLAPRYGILCIAAYMAASGQARGERLRAAGYTEGFIVAVRNAQFAVAIGMFLFGLQACWALRRPG